MAHQNQEQIQAVIDGVRELLSNAKENLSSVPSILSRVTNHLQQIDNYLSHIIGVSAQTAEPRRKFSPIPMPNREKIEAPAVMKTAEEMEAEQLKHEVDEIFPEFANRDSTELMDALTDIQVRGIAKRAGFKVTEEDPEHITLEFIEQIKAKIILDRSQKKAMEEGQKKQPGSKKKG